MHQDNNRALIIFFFSCFIQSPGDARQTRPGAQRVGEDSARGRAHPHHRLGQRAATSKGQSKLTPRSFLLLLVKPQRDAGLILFLRPLFFFFFGGGGERGYSRRISEPIDYSEEEEEEEEKRGHPAGGNRPWRRRFIYKERERVTWLRAGKTTNQ